MIYLDSSAIVKLVIAESETTALRFYLRRNADTPRVTCALAAVEVVRAVRSAGAPAIARAREVLRTLNQFALTPDLLDEAADLPAEQLRSLDAIHLAAAARLGPGLQALVCYDVRLRAAAESLGLPTAAPARR